MSRGSAGGVFVAVNASVAGTINTSKQQASVARMIKRCDQLVLGLSNAGYFPTIQHSFAMLHYVQKTVSYAGFFCIHVQQFISVFTNSTPRSTPARSTKQYDIC